MVLPEQLFIHQGTISYIEEPPQQDGVIHQWAGTHDLKKENREWWKGKCKVVTGDNKERCKIIQAYHDLPTYGHPPGINQTKELVLRYYWWPQLNQNVLDYVKGTRSTPIQRKPL